jgi:hypothetical protein
VVEVITQDVNGDPVTSTMCVVLSPWIEPIMIHSFCSSTVSVNTVALGTTAGQGPVGSPESTVSGIPTIYTYTTTDGSGATIALTCTVALSLSRTAQR